MCNLLKYIRLKLTPKSECVPIRFSPESSTSMCQYVQYNSKIVLSFLFFFLESILYIYSSGALEYLYSTWTLLHLLTLSTFNLFLISYSQYRDPGASSHHCQPCFSLRPIPLIHNLWETTGRVMDQAQSTNLTPVWFKDVHTLKWQTRPWANWKQLQTTT